MYMTGAMRAPTADKALQLSQQVQTAERQLQEALTRHADELLRARQAVHYEWKQFYEKELKEKEHINKDKEKELKEMEKMNEDKEKELKEKEKTIMYMRKWS